MRRAPVLAASMLSPILTTLSVLIASSTGSPDGTGRYRSPFGSGVFTTSDEWQAVLKSASWFLKMTY
jgi:hypothetical protein